MSYHIGRVVLSSLCVGVFGAAGFWWCSFCRLQPAKRTPPKTSCTKNSNTQWTENNTTDVVTHQHSRKLLKMDILMSETCWAENKWNKIASVIKLVFYSSTIAMMHGPINIRFTFLLHWSCMWCLVYTITLFNLVVPTCSVWYLICFGKWVWFTESNIVSVIFFFYFLFYLLIWFLI